MMSYTYVQFIYIYLINAYLFNKCIFIFIVEIARAQNTNSKPESAYLDINSDKPIRLTAKIMVPAKEFPRVLKHII